MNIETKFALFYLSLNDLEKTKLKDAMGSQVLTRMMAEADVQSAMVDAIIGNNKAHATRRDEALIQIVRHIGNMSESNLALSRSIEAVTGKTISRPEKRSQYELKGLLLVTLLNASDEELRKIRKALVQTPTESKKGVGGLTSLDRWFNIILGSNK